MQCSLGREYRLPPTVHVAVGTRSPPVVNETQPVHFALRFINGSAGGTSMKRKFLLYKRARNYRRFQVGSLKIWQSIFMS